MNQNHVKGIFKETKIYWHELMLPKTKYEFNYC